MDISKKLTKALMHSSPGIPTFQGCFSIFTAPTSSFRYNKTSLFETIGKPILERNISFLLYEEITKTCKLLYPYFNFNNTLLLSTMIGTSLFLGFMVPIQQQAFRAFIDIATENPTFSVYIYPLLNILSMVLLVSIVHMINAVSCKKLRDDLSFEMRIAIASQYLETGVFVDPSKTVAGAKIINPSKILVEKIDNLCRDLITLSNARISILIHGIAALYALYLTSGFLTISLFNLSISIPSLVLTCLLYSYAYNFFASSANNSVKKIIAERNTAIDILNKLVNHFLAHAKTVAFLDGAPFENWQYFNQNRKIHTIDQESLLPQARLSLTTKLHWELSHIIGAVAQLSKGSINSIDTVNSAYNFSQVVKTMCFRNDNLELLKSLDNNRQEIENLLLAIHQYAELIQNCKITRFDTSDKEVTRFDTSNTSNIVLDLKIPNKNNNSYIIINKVLEKNKTYRVLGASGCGKTFLFEIVKGINLVSVTDKENKIGIPLRNLFLPQIPHIIKGKDHSLMQSILYPSTLLPTESQIEKAKELLSFFKFEKQIIDELITPQDWDSKLSPGQKQQIAIISCFLKAPDAMFLDEPFASMDPESRKRAVDILHKVPSVRVYIEHKPDNEKEFPEDDSITGDRPIIKIIEEPF